MNEIAVKQAPKNKKGWFTINIALGADQESRKQFVGTNDGDFLIERGHDVDVPPSVLHVLDCAVIGVRELDASDDTKDTIVMRKRFPYTIVKAL